MKTTRKFRRKTRKSRRKYKKRGGSGFDRQAFRRSQFMSDPEYRKERFSNLKKNISNTTQRLYNRGKDLVRKSKKGLGLGPTRGEQKEIDAAKDASNEKEEEKRDDKYETSRDPVDERDLKILVEAAEEKAAKTAAKEAEAEKEELQRINGNKLFDTTANFIGVEFWYNDDVNSKKRYLGNLMKGYYEKKSEWQGRKYWDYYLRFDNSGEVKNIKTHSAGEGDSPYANIFYYKKTDKGGKKARKSRRKRKMKGGSLIGTDILTGLNTTDTNSVLAFGTTGGTKYMLNELQAGPVESGPYLSSRTEVNPNLA